MLGNVTQELDNVGEVVFVPRVILAGMRLKEVVARSKLKGLYNNDVSYI